MGIHIFSSESAIRRSQAPPLMHTLWEEALARGHCPHGTERKQHLPHIRKGGYDYPTSLYCKQDEENIPFNARSARLPARTGDGLVLGSTSYTHAAQMAPSLCEAGCRKWRNRDHPHREAKQLRIRRIVETPQGSLPCETTSVRRQVSNAAR